MMSPWCVLGIMEQAICNGEHRSAFGSFASAPNLSFTSRNYSNGFRLDVSWFTSNRIRFILGGLLCSNEPKALEICPKASLSSNFA